MRRALLTALLALTLILTPSIVNGQTDWQALIKTVEQSTYRIQSQSRNDEGQIEIGVCTGWSINEKKGYVVTAAHCLGQYMFADGKHATIVYVNQKADMMVLQSDVHKPSLVPYDGTIEKGDSLLAVGYGEGFDKPLAEVCKVASPDQEVNDIMPGEHFLIAACPYVPGMSGGPVVNQDGKLISIVQMTGDGIGFGRTLLEIVGAVGFYGN